MHRQLRNSVLAFAALSALLSACYSPSLGDGKLACSASDTCPDGYQCAGNGYCYANGAAVPPDAPTQVTASPGVRSAQITWAASAHDGGSAITSYTVIATPGGATATAASGSTSATLNGLQDGTAYTFTVTALNAIGSSRASAPSAPVTTWSLPGAPTNVVATALATAPSLGASLDWSAPTDSGGTPVTGYVVQLSSNGGAYVHISPDFSGTHATVSGLAASGSYTFVVGAVNAVGAGEFSAASAMLVLTGAPAQPVIVAADAVTVGDTGIVAKVAAVDGMTYNWSLSANATLTGSDLHGVNAGGFNSLTYSLNGGALAGDAVALSVVAVDASQQTSTPATKSQLIAAQPVAPAISLAGLGATESVEAGDTSAHAASVVSPVATSTYAWSANPSSKVSLSFSSGASITFTLGASAQAGDTILLQATETNAAGRVGASPGTGTITVIAPLGKPVITASNTAVAQGRAYTASQSARQAGVTYQWTIVSLVDGAILDSTVCLANGQPNGPDGCTDHGDGTISFSVGASLQVGHGALELQLVARNAAGGTTRATPVDLPVIALPSATIAFGPPPSGDSLGANISAGQTREAFVASGAASYAWTITPGAIVSGGATNDVVFNAGAAAAGATLALSVTATNAAGSVTGNATVTIEPAPGTPVLDSALVDADLRSPKSLTYGAHALITFTDSANANGLPMAVDCATDANASIESGSFSMSPKQFVLDVSPAPSSINGAIATTVTCTETNAAGDTAQGTLVIPLLPALTVALTPANGATDVAASTGVTATFSYAPHAGLSADNTCDGTGTASIKGSDGSCVAFTISPALNDSATAFTFTPSSPLAGGITYTASVRGADSHQSGVVDAQGVTLPLTTSTSFTIHVTPIPEVTAVSSSMHLQSASLSWTNPTGDPNFNHVHIRAIPSGNASATEVDADTANASAASATLNGLLPATAYQFKLQVSDDAANTKLSAGDTSQSGTTGLTGAAVDFTSRQVVAGLGPTFNGVNANQFFATWDQANLYFAFAQADGDPLQNALRIDGDALWIAIDSDGSGSGADVNGESITATGGVTSGKPDQIAWPFNADYVIELKKSGGNIVTNLRAVTANGGSWNPAQYANYNGFLAEVQVPGLALAASGQSTAPAAMRFAAAFLNAPSGGNSTVFDLAPASFSASTTDGHVPATDVLGKLASITNGIDPKGLAFNVAHTATAMQDSVRTPAPALVTVRLDASGAGFAPSDVVQMLGDHPPLSYTLPDSSYALAADGTRGSVNSVGHYVGVFNFGITTAPTPSSFQELFFKFTQNGNPETTFPSTNDRVWTLSGQTETLGTAPIVFNAVYSASHTFQLTFAVGFPSGNQSNVVTGNLDALGDWTAASGVPLNNSSGVWISAPVSFSNMDFVSGSSDCSGAPAAFGCAMQFKEAGADGNNWETSGNHVMNDDVINHRILSWNASDLTQF